MAIDPENVSAFDIITDTLREYGLENLVGFVNDYITNNDNVTRDSLLVELRKQPEYQQRFSANEQRRKAGLPVIPENEYLSMEREYAQLLRAAGLPPGFYDGAEDFTNFIANDISISELNSRVEQGYLAVTMSNPEVVRQMRELYGVSESQLAAYFLDPTRAAPILKRQAESAQIAAQGRLLAGEQISVAQAEELAQAGVTQDQARAGFAAIEQAQGLFTANLEEGSDIGLQEQIGAVFGTSAAAQQRLRQRARKRQAQFETGGGFTSGAEGTTAIA